MSKISNNTGLENFLKNHPVQGTLPAPLCSHTNRVPWGLVIFSPRREVPKAEASCKVTVVLPDERQKIVWRGTMGGLASPTLSDAGLRAIHAGGGEQKSKC